MTLSVTIAVPARHRAGDPVVWSGDEKLEAGDVVTDASGNIVLTETGAVALHTAASIKTTKRESFRFFAAVNSGEMYLELDPDQVVEVRINGVVRQTGWAVNGRTLTLTGVNADRTLVQIAYEATRLHRRGEQRYVNVAGQWVAAKYSSAPGAEFAAGTLKQALGNEARLFYGGEIARYFATDVKPADPAGTLHHRIMVTSANAGRRLPLLRPGARQRVDRRRRRRRADRDDSRRHDDGRLRRRRRPLRGARDQRPHDAAGGQRERHVHVGTKSGFWPGGFTNDRGHANGIHARLVVDGGGDYDIVDVDDRFDLANDAGLLTRDLLRGVFDTNGELGYTELERLDIHLGDAPVGNSLLIESTHGSGAKVAYTNVDTGAGNDFINVETHVRPTTIVDRHGQRPHPGRQRHRRRRPDAEQRARPDPATAG